MPTFEDYGVIQGWSDTPQSAHTLRRRSAVQKFGEYRSNLEVIANSAYSAIATKTTIAGCTTTQIAATAHGARVGDRITVLTGNYTGIIIYVDTVIDANNFVMSVQLSVPMSIGDTFQVQRPSTMLVNTSGSLVVSGTYAEDTPHVSGDFGNFILGVRVDSAATIFTDNPGDYSPINVTQKGAIRPDISIDWQENVARGILKAEDAAAGDGDAGVGILFRRQDSNTILTTANGDYSHGACTSTGAVRVDLAPEFQGSVSSPVKLAGSAVVVATDGVMTAGTFRQDVQAATNATGQYNFVKSNDLGSVYVDPTRRGTDTHTQPTVTNTTSFTILAANTARRYLFIQNNSAANILINLNAGALTGIVPTATNLGIVLTPGSNYESPPNFCPVTAITAYQSSGASINTISVVEGV